MEHNELINTLRREGEETINRLWSEARAEAEKIATETSLRIEELRKRHGESLELVLKREERSVLSEAEKKVRAIRLSLAHGLSERLFPLALSCLGELRAGREREVFTSMAGELPEGKWEEIRVNPGDEGIAAELFPGARIVRDCNISGGLEAVRGDGRICVTNTFEKRLEKAWQDILPLLIKDICGEGEGDGSDSAI